MTGRRGTLAALAWPALLAATLVVLHRLGAGALAAPPLTLGDRLDAWASSRAPAEQAFALVRVGALAFGWYLAALTVLAAAARAAGARRLARVLVGAAPRWLRPALAATTLTPVLLTPLASPHHPPTASAVLRDVGDNDAPGTATMRRLEAGEAMPTPERAERTWTIEAGDHLWAVADETLADAWGRSPSDAEVVPYWRELIELNRSGLADPDNPDLVFPGQVVRLPDVPRPPAT